MNSIEDLSDDKKDRCFVFRSHQERSDDLI